MRTDPLTLMAIAITIAAISGAAIEPRVEDHILNMKQGARSGFDHEVDGDTYTSTAAATVGATSTADYVKYTDWNSGHKVKYVEASFDGTGSGGACQTKCTDYAMSNNYASDFVCSYQDGKSPHSCTVSADGDTRTADGSSWKKCKGSPRYYSPSPPPPPPPLAPTVLTDEVEKIILTVANDAEEAINDAVIAVLTKELDPITGDDGGPLYSDSAKSSMWGGTLKVDYSVKVSECYPKSGWNAYYVDYNHWNSGHKVKYPVASFDGTGSGGACQTKCTEYATNKGYASNFVFSYEDGKSPHNCTVSADGDTRTADGSNWKKRKGSAGYSLDIGPYTSITSDSYISSETGVGSIGIVGDAAVNELVCKASVSSDVYLFGKWVAGAYGDATLTSSARGDATVTMDSKSCTTDGNSGILLSPKTCDIKLSEASVNSCKCELNVVVLDGYVDVGALVCDLLNADVGNIVESLANSGAGAATDAIKDEFKSIYTECLSLE